MFKQDYMARRGASMMAIAASVAATAFMQHQQFMNAPNPAFRDQLIGTLKAARDAAEWSPVGNTSWRRLKRAFNGGWRPPASLTHSERARRGYLHSSRSA